MLKQTLQSLFDPIQTFHLPKIAEKIIYLDDEEHKKGCVYASVSVGVSILKPEVVIDAMKNLPDGRGKRKAFTDILNSVIDIADKRMYEHKHAKK